MPSPTPSDVPTFEALRVLAVEVAREAGALLAARSAGRGGVVGTKSTLTDLVTEADRASEALIGERLALLRPGDGLIGEEGAARAGTSGVRWIVDPLDGTVNYVYGIPGSGVSVGVEVSGERAAGAVHDISRGETFSAALGGGAWLDNSRIQVTTAADLSTSLIGTGFAYATEVRAAQGRAVGALLPRVRDIRRAGAASLDLCWVACGRLDGYYERGLQLWDLAAGDVIVREAGGMVGAIDGGPPVPGSVIAAGAALFEPLRALVREAEAGASASPAG
ncbi:MAG: inositol monophosphatase [Dehalococcoidia bacterium]|nr:inositol monophosphatase [Dehalococcoidia bacterium]